MDKNAKRVISAQIRNKALDNLVNNDISPFLNKYSIDHEIESFESTLKIMDDIDSAFIDSML